MISVYNWDLLSDESIYYYCLGSCNIVVWHEGWDWTFEEFSTDRVWMEDWLTHEPEHYPMCGEEE